MMTYLLSHVLCLFQAMPITILHDFMSDDGSSEVVVVIIVYPFVPTIQAVRTRFPLSSSVPVPFHVTCQYYIHV